MEKTIERRELVLYRKRREPTLAVLIKNSGKESEIINEEGKRSVIKAEKIIYRSQIFLQDTDDHNSLRKQFREIRKTLEGVEKPAIKDLWECVRDEKREYSFEELLDLYSGKATLSEEEKLQLFWTIDKNQTYFKRGKNGYTPNSRTDVNLALLRKERNRLREVERTKAVEWVLSILDENAERTEPSGFDPKYYIKLLEDYVVADHSTPAPVEAKRFASECGIKTQEQAIETLKKMGECEPDDDAVSILLKPYEVYEPGIIKHAHSILKADYDFADLDTYDSSPVYSIDDETTRDIDDAISFGKKDGIYEIGIHITDVGYFIGRNTDIDKSSMLRGESVYLPDKTINMFPPELVYNRLSLVEDGYRPVLSLFVSFDNDFNIVNYQFRRLKLRIERNLTYKEAEKIFTTETWGVELKNLAFSLRDRRIRNNAFLLQLPEIKFEIDNNGNPSIYRNTMDTTPHIVISELMILINNLAAELLTDNGVPCIYRTQPEQIDQEARMLDRNDPLYPVKITKYLKPSRLSTKPSVHSSLGLDYYTQVSSPIRRYLDIVMQRQIVSVIDNGKPCYGEQELENLISRTGAGMVDRRYVQRARKKYWLFKYLKYNVSELEGYVSSVNENKISIYFPDILMELPISGTDEKLSEGDNVLVSIRDVDPLRKKINLKFKCKLDNKSRIL